MFMFFKSTDCIDIFPSNSASHFHVKLPETFRFKKQKHLCALIELRVPLVLNDVDSLLFMTNFITENYVGDKKLPVLHRCFITDWNSLCLERQHVAVYMDVKDIDTEIIEISVVDSDTLDYVQFADGILYCGFDIIHKH